MSVVRLKLLIGGTIILVAVFFLAYKGFTENKGYYLFVDELKEMGESAIDRRIKIHGAVVSGSILKTAEFMRFEIQHNRQSLVVMYPSHLPVPDTFGEAIPVIIDGKLNASGVFEGERIQAKCASKYEAAYSRYQSGVPKDSSYSVDHGAHY